MIKDYCNKLLRCMLYVATLYLTWVVAADFIENSPVINKIGGFVCLAVAWATSYRCYKDKIEYV